MQAFTTFSAVAAPIEMGNVDTDKLIPNRFFRKARGSGLQRYLLYDLRFNVEGDERPEFVLNMAPYRNAGILVAGPNFGCGSAREAAVYVVVDYGIRAVIAPSFGDIYLGNMLQNGLLPVVLPEDACSALRRRLTEEPGARITIDLASQTVTGPLGELHRFEIDPGTKERLLKGLDDVALILEHLPEIEEFEKRYHAQLPWRTSAALPK